MYAYLAGKIFISSREREREREGVEKMKMKIIPFLANAACSMLHAKRNVKG